MTYQIFIEALRLATSFNLKDLQLAVAEKILYQTGEPDLEKDREASQQIKVNYELWKKKEDQYQNLFAFITRTGIDLNTRIPDNHKDFPFDFTNLN